MRITSLPCYYGNIRIPLKEYSESFYSSAVETFRHCLRGSLRGLPKFQRSPLPACSDLKPRWSHRCFHPPGVAFAIPIMARPPHSFTKYVEATIFTLSGVYPKEHWGLLAPVSTLSLVVTNFNSIFG